MTARVALTKMHGACNDFVILDRRASPVEALDSFALRVCNRRTGVGADGLIEIEASPSGLVMRTFNADGSEAEMCGNGVRCAARWLDEAGEGERLTFETAAGRIRTEVVAREPDYLVRVTFPVERIRTQSLAFLDDAVFVDMENPHVVIFRQDAAAFDLEATAVRLQNHPLFPRGTNVHVAAVDGIDRLRLRHWERGAGVTMACGTGAVAAAAAAIESRRVSSPVETLVPGGRLVVEWDGNGAARLTGPAVRVFDTEVRA